MSEFTGTDPPIEYRKGAAGFQGARFSLYPVKDKHTEEDVKVAMRWLRKEMKMAYVQVRWKTLGDEKDLPENVPDEAIIADLQRKIGELESYVEELEVKIKQNEHSHKLELSAERKVLKKQLLKDEEVAHYKQLYEKKQAEVTKLRKEVSELITKYYQGKLPDSGTVPVVP